MQLAFASKKPRSGMESFRSSAPAKHELDGQCLPCAKIFVKSGKEEIQMIAEGTRKHNYRREENSNLKISIYTDLAL
jgi:hypothetical protein